mgnify:CR=1 FL=1
MTTFTPTHDVVTEATAAGFFPPRHNVEITQVTELTDRVMRLTFRDPFIASHAKPAQFVNLFTHDDFMLMPRPFGVSEVDGDEVSVIFAVVGHGTEQLAGLQAGDTVDVLDADGRTLARAAWSPKSQIRARVWSFDPQTIIDDAFFKRRVADAGTV